MLDVWVSIEDSGHPKKTFHMEKNESDGWILVGKAAAGEWNHPPFTMKLLVILTSRHLKAKGHEITHTVLPRSKETAKQRESTAVHGSMKWNVQKKSSARIVIFAGTANSNFPNFKFCLPVKSTCFPFNRKGHRGKHRPTV